MKSQIKIKFRLLLPLLFLVCIQICQLKAQTDDLETQTDDLKFNIFTGSNGIILGKINGMTRDKYGFMWFSDQSNRCIIRYDGTKLTKYKNDPSDSNSLGGSYPECLFADPSGIIWIGFYGQGVDRFDPHTNTFTHFRHDDNDPESLSSDVVSALLVDHLGNVWVGNNGGLDLLDQKTGKFKHFNHKDNDSTSLSHNEVRALYEDHKGTIWVGTGNEFTSSDDLGGLNRLDRITGTFTRYLHDSNNPNSLINNKVRAIFEDNQGTFWIGTAGDGLHTMDRKKGTFERLTYDPLNPEKLSRPALVDDTDHITFINEDALHELWIGTLSNGLIRYNLETKKITHYTNFNGGTGNSRDTTTWWANYGSDGIVWLSTQAAILYKIDLYQHILPHFGSANDALFAFCEGPESIQWMATANGLIRIDPNKGTTEVFKHDNQNPDSLINDEISDLIAEKNGDVWVATKAGLDRFDSSSQKFVHYLNNEGSGGKPIAVWDLVKNKDSTLWVGTDGDGLIHFDPLKNMVINKYHFIGPKDPNGLSAPVVYTMFMDDSSGLWIGTESGIDRLDIQTNKIKHYLKGIGITCIYKDIDEVIWVGTVGGLYRYSKELDDFTIGSSINDALDFPNVITMVGDQNNNLWIVSSPGLYKINPKRNYVTFFNREYGVAEGNRFNYNSAFKTHDGKLIFGDIAGYYMFYPEEFSDVPDTSNIWFSGFSLNNQVIFPGANSVLSDPIITTNTIDLAYDQNAFSFDFSVVNFRGNNNKIRYKLENYDKNWRFAGSENRVDYFRVPPGNYSMHIKLTNDSNGSEIEKSIAIIISPPWWQTWWAYTIYVLIFIGGVFLVDRFQRKRLLEKAKAQAKEKELEQAREIEKAYHELKTTQAQLIHSEKMASLGELTAGIAHEIQNPLNFVNNFSEVNKELLDEMIEEIDNGNIDEVKAIANDVLENEGKINYHGQRASSIVKGMLQHSRSSTGTKEPTNINVLADEFLRLAYHGLRAKDKSFNATLVTEFDESICDINIIPQDIGRVILNLFTNAFYAVNEKSQLNLKGYEPTVTLITKKIGNFVSIAVIDNGNGIIEKVMDKIFQPFFTTKPTGKGTGLGLSMSYDIVKAHGGEIKVDTKEGHGTTFIIKLPKN